MASVRVSTESGRTWDDPAEDVILELLEDIRNDDEGFIVADRLSDPSGHTYVEATRDRGSRWLVEFREGSADRHFPAYPPHIQDVHLVIVGWIDDMPDWRSGLDWEQVRF